MEQSCPFILISKISNQGDILLDQLWRIRGIKCIHFFFLCFWYYSRNHEIKATLGLHTAKANSLSWKCIEMVLTKERSILEVRIISKKVFKTITKWNFKIQNINYFLISLYGIDLFPSPIKIVHHWNKQISSRIFVLTSPTSIYWCI